MSQIQFFKGITLNNLPAVQEVNTYRDQVLKNFSDLICEYFEYAVFNRGQLETVSQPLSVTLADIAKILMLSEEETANYLEYVTLEICADDSGAESGSVE